MRRSPQGALLKGVSTFEKKLEAKSMERENYHKIKSILRRRVPKKAVNTKEPFKSSKGLKTGTGTWRESKVDKHSRRMKNSIHRHRIVIYRSNISLAWFHKYVFLPFFFLCSIVVLFFEFPPDENWYFFFPEWFLFFFPCLSFSHIPVLWFGSGNQIINFNRMLLWFVKWKASTRNKKRSSENWARKIKMFENWNMKETFESVTPLSMEWLTHPYCKMYK